MVGFCIQEREKTDDAKENFLLLFNLNQILFFINIYLLLFNQISWLPWAKRWRKENFWFISRVWYQTNITVD